MPSKCDRAEAQFWQSGDNVRNRRRATPPTYEFSPSGRGPVNENMTPTELNNIYLAQEDGSLPTTVAEGSAPGESGVSILSIRFRGGAHFNATPKQHLVWLSMSHARFDCRIGGRSLTHEAPAGSLAICPAGIDAAADAEENLDTILLAINPGHLALAAAENSVHEGELMERLSGRDDGLLEFARRLVSESVDNYPNGPLFWNELASRLIDGLIARHISGGKVARARLSKKEIQQLRDYVAAHLDEPINVATLASITGRRSTFPVCSPDLSVQPHTAMSCIFDCDALLNSVATGDLAWLK